MSVEVINVDPEVPIVLSASELEVGVLYKLAYRNYDTVYTKSFSGEIVWFGPPTEDGPRVGIHSPGYSGRFVLAPEGTTVILKN